MNCFNVIPGYIIFWLILDHLQTASLPSTYGTVQTISSLLYTQQYMLTKGTGVNYALANFQTCLKQEDKDWNKVKFLFSVEGEGLSLECSACVPHDKKIRWKTVTLEGVEEEVSISINRMIIDHGRRLVVKSLEPDLISYYCYWEDDYNINHVLPVMVSMWTIETVAVEKFEKISVRNWQKTKVNQPSSHEITLFGGKERLEVSLSWQNWSECSKCSVVGKRYKVGFCSIQHLGQSKPYLVSLTFYKLPISCSLLLDLHPEMISEGISFTNFEESQEEVHDLGKKHVLMIGYCKKSICSGRESVSSSVKEQVFKRFPMLGENRVEKSEETSKMEESIGGKRILVLMRSLVKGVPIGWNTLPEMLALVFLIGLQAYIIYLICQNRKVTKNG